MSACCATHNAISLVSVAGLKCLEEEEVRGAAVCMSVITRLLGHHVKHTDVKSLLVILQRLLDTGVINFDVVEASHGSAVALLPMPVGTQYRLVVNEKDLGLRVRE